MEDSGKSRNYAKSEENLSKVWTSLISNAADVANQGFLVDCLEDIFFALLGARANFLFQSRIDTGLTERGKRFERAKLRVCTALFGGEYPQMLPGSQIRVTIQDEAKLALQH